jgi:hypothetical protein
MGKDDAKHQNDKNLSIAERLLMVYYTQCLAGRLGVPQPASGGNWRSTATSARWLVLSLSRYVRPSRFPSSTLFGRRSPCFGVPVASPVPCNSLHMHV